MPPGIDHLPSLQYNVFSTAFIVKLHPTHVFQDPADKTAQALQATAGAFLRVYDGLPHSRGHHWKLGRS